MYDGRRAMFESTLKPRITQCVCVSNNRLQYAIVFRVFAVFSIIVLCFLLFDNNRAQYAARSRFVCVLNAVWVGHFKLKHF